MCMNYLSRQCWFLLKYHHELFWMWCSLFFQCSQIVIILRVQIAFFWLWCCYFCFFFFLFPNSWLWLFAMSQQNLDFSIYYIFSVTLLSLQRSVLSLYLSYLWTSDCNIFLLPKLVKHTSTKVYTFRLVYDMLWVPFSLIVFFLMFLRVSSLLLSVAAVKVGTRFGLHME